MYSRSSVTCRSVSAGWRPAGAAAAAAPAGREGPTLAVAATARPGELPRPPPPGRHPRRLPPTAAAPAPALSIAPSSLRAANPLPTGDQLRRCRHGTARHGAEAPTDADGGGARRTETGPRSPDEM